MSLFLVQKTTTLFFILKKNFFYYFQLSRVTKSDKMTFFLVLSDIPLKVGRVEMDHFVPNFFGFLDGNKKAAHSKNEETRSSSTRDSHQPKIKV